MNVIEQARSAWWPRMLPATPPPPKSEFRWMHCEGCGVKILSDNTPPCPKCRWAMKPMEGA